MTVRLYYEDAYLETFDASVLDVELDGHRQRVRLDRTGFYPTTGGQPFDTGTLAACQIVDVIEDDHGDVVHVLEGGSPLQAGQQVRGTLDWSRRFDHMQQHTGQHLLSAAFVSILGVQTVSFHLGSAISTIDLDRELAPAQLARAEDAANRVVWEDRPVTVRYATPDEASVLPLRKIPERIGRLRLIEVDRFDLSACGGTHVARTGSVGLIAITGWERFKGGQRVQFVCGGRALVRLRLLQRTVAETARRLSALPDDIPAAIERLQTETREQRRTLTTALAELVTLRAAALVAAAEPHPRGRVIAQIVDADAASLKALAMDIAGRPGCVALLASPASPTMLVAARSRDVAVSCQGIVAAVTAQFGGRGGGKPDLAQGGGIQAPPAVVLEFARRSLEALSGDA